MTIVKYINGYKWLKFHQNSTFFPPVVTIAYKTLSIIPELYVNLPISLFFVNIVNIAQITFFFLIG